MAEVHIGDEPIDAAEVEARVAEIENGAICSFIGQVRNRSRNRDVVYLEYNAYVPMAARMMQRIAEEAERRWSCTVAIYHRLGRIGLGEASVVIAVGSPHRAEAFEACRFCIDTLKDTVPIWKRETCADGSYWIEGDTAIESEDPTVAAAL